MKYLFACICFLAMEPAIGQSAALEALDGQKSVNERFQIMKAKSQTYGDYKVIKEHILDRVWKISMDSAGAAKDSLRTAAASISSLKKELLRIQVDLQQKEASQAEIVYASDHISIIGIGFEKATFVGLVMLMLVGLLLLLGTLTGKLKLMSATVKEKMDVLTAIFAEFEDYKRKSLDRQTKLSRELQTERNKLLELKKS